MKTLFIISAIGMFCTMSLRAKDALPSKDTLIIDHPNRVSIITNGDTKQVQVIGKEGNPNFEYSWETVLKHGEPSITRTKNNDWNFEIPFSKKNKKTRRHRNEVRMHFFGLGFINELNAPKGMDIAMGSSIEILGPTLEWAYYPGYSSFNFSWGVGCNWRNYRMTGRTRFIKEENGNIGFSSYPEGADIEYSRLRVFSWTMPILLNGNVTRGISLSAGPIVNFNTRGRLLTKYTLNDEKIKERSSNIHQNPVTIDLFAHMKVKCFGVYAKYTPFEILNTEYGPDFKGVSVGMTLFW